MGNRCDKGVHLIIPNFYLGNCDTLCNLDKLRQLKIRAVIDLSGEACPVDPAINYLRIAIKDRPDSDIRQYFDQTNQFIDRYLSESQNVLVNCFMGISRSSSIVIAYIMWKYGLSAQQSIDWVQQKRNCVKPNEGFLKQLQLYEKELRS